MIAVRATYLSDPIEAYYGDFQAFRRDANLWFRFTEAGFDDFMQAQKL